MCEEYRKNVAEIYTALLLEYIDKNKTALKNIVYDKEKTLFDMIEVFIKEVDKMPIDKASRWFGFIQAFLVIYSIDNVKNMRDKTRPLFNKIYNKYKLQFETISV